MPRSIHKVNDSSTIKSFTLPIGILSEEAQESLKSTEPYSEKSSRININTDIFQRILLSSVPLMSTLRNVENKFKKLLPKFEDLLLNTNFCNAMKNCS
jgi:hypothetical protein